LKFADSASNDFMSTPFDLVAAGEGRQSVSISGHRQSNGGRQQLLNDRTAHRVAMRRLHTEDWQQLFGVHVSTCRVLFFFMREPLKRSWNKTILLKQFFWCITSVLFDLSFTSLVLATRTFANGMADGLFLQPVFSCIGYNFTQRYRCHWVTEYAEKY